MIDIFTKRLPPGNYTGIISYPSINFVKRNMKLWINKVLDYYNVRRKRAVSNQNMLARLIEVSLPNIHGDFVEYYMHVRANAKYITKRFGIVSDRNRGEFNYNVLQDGASELFILTEKDTNILDISKTFMDRSPIRAVANNDIMLTYDLPYYHIVNQTKDSLYVYEIDFIEMMMQYRSWALWRENLDTSIDINQYVAMVLIPNIVRSSVDLNIWNRFKYIARSKDREELKEHKNNHPFLVPDYDKFIDRVLIDIVEQYQNMAFNVDRVINTVPTLINDNMLDMLRLGNQFHTAQSLWSKWLARVDDMIFLLEFLGERGRQRNRELITRLPYKIKAIRNRVTTLPLNTPTTILEYFTSSLDRIEELTNY